MALAIPPLESEPEPEPNPEVPKPAPGTKLGLDVPNPVPVPGRSPTMTDLESFFGSLSLPVSRVAALADKLGIRGASDFKEFSEHELVEEYGFEADHIRKIFGALGPEEPRAPLSLVECKTCTQGSHHAHTCGRGKSQSRSRGHRSLPVQVSTDSMAASSDPPEPVPAAASMQRSPTSKAQREAGAVGDQSLRKGSPDATYFPFSIALFEQARLEGSPHALPYSFLGAAPVRSPRSQVQAVRERY